MYTSTRTEYIVAVQFTDGLHIQSFDTLIKAKEYANIYKRHYKDVTIQEKTTTISQIYK